MKKLGKILRRILPWTILLGVIGFLIWNYSNRTMWVYVRTELPALKGVSIQLDRENYDKKNFMVTYSIVNRSSKYISSSPPAYILRVEQWTEEGWRYRTDNPDHISFGGGIKALPAVGYELSPGTTGSNFSFSLHNGLYRWEPGRYRLAWDFDAGSLEAGWTEYTVYQEFTVE